RGDVQLLTEVRTAHDAREHDERPVGRAVLRDERLERATALRVLVGIRRAGRVEPLRALAPLDVGDLVRLDEHDLRVPVDEPADEPRGRRSVHLDPSLRHPCHRAPSYETVRSTSPMTPAATMMSGSGTFLA